MFFLFLSVTCLGEAKIVEVSHKLKKGYHVVKNDPNPEETAAKKKNLEERREEIKKSIELLQYKAELLDKERKFLSSFGERLGPNDKVKIFAMINNTCCLSHCQGLCKIILPIFF